MNTNKKQYGYCNKGLAIAGACLATCQKFIAQFDQVRNRLTNEFSERLAADQSVLRLALNEAEALAWESEVPQLVFATLAREKVQAAATWEYRQQTLRRHSPLFAPGLAAVAHV